MKPQLVSSAMGSLAPEPVQCLTGEARICAHGSLFNARWSSEGFGFLCGFEIRLRRTTGDMGSL